ncbi:MAG: DUF4271 domain-containing protein [Prevotella sp.]|nr:DUF4271 domain-containing protein [Prevotella sp.]
MTQTPVELPQTTGTGVQNDSVAPKHVTLTPAIVLRWLPRDATPAQQDSAIQAHFKPSPIRWSSRQDTLHLPGHDKGHNMLDVQLPQYYREGFFSKDTLFHPELPGGRYGTAGDPVPYSIRADNVITGLLLFCFIVAVVAFSNVRGFISRQFKTLLYLPHDGTTDATETANEVRFQLFLVVLTSLLLSLLFYCYTLHYIGDTFVLQSQYYLIVIYLGMVLGYFLLKALLYTAVNHVFFDNKRNGQWMKSQMFITAVEGMLVFPIVLLQVYFDVDTKNVIIYFTVVLVLVKILTIFKCYTIFFSRNIVRLQIILYLCALELMPLLALWRAMVIVANQLKINF